MSKRLAALIDTLDPLELKGDADTRVSGISCDSRRVVPGDLFVAIPGTRLDGSKFVGEAIERGAVALVVENAPADGPAAIVRVRDARRALAHIAVKFFEDPSRELRLVGITGTNGKTTTSLLLESILTHAGRNVGILGTLSYRWAGMRLPAATTTPESLELQRLFRQMRNDGVEDVVMEVSSHALALGRVEGASFDAGVFTNLSQDHLDFHQTMEEYFSAKATLFTDHLRRCGGISVINADDPWGRRLIGMSPDSWSYSASGARAKIRVSRSELTDTGIAAEYQTPLGSIALRSNLLGRLNLQNITAAVTAAMAIGVPPEAIRRGINAVSHVDGRLQLVATPPELGLKVIVDYAHTPDAMEKSLDCMREMTTGRLFVVFGCGGDRDKGKRPLMGRVAAEFGDVVVLTSDNPRSEEPSAIIGQIEEGVLESGLGRIRSKAPEVGERGYVVDPDRRSAIELALSWAAPGDTVFIGGKGHETYQLVGKQVLEFDDRLVVSRYFEQFCSTLLAGRVR